MKTGDIWLLEGGKLVEGASETQAAWAIITLTIKPVK